VTRNEHGSHNTLTVALVSDVFFGPDGDVRLRVRLSEAASRGAELAVLPELPLDAWVPATRTVRDEDAERPEGPRHQRLASAARTAGIGVIGGAIVRDPATGTRHNTALVFDRRGVLLGAYRKLHLPSEDGFWETDHYVPGDQPPAVIRGLGMPIGVQICSDVNRPEGSHLLGGMGAEAIFVPRATETGTWARWKLVLCANAVTSAAYVLSVNRPEPGLRIPLGGPSVAIDPHGGVVAESLEPVILVPLSSGEVAAARRAYPGYLPVRAGLYAEAWRKLPS
jgi:N-carbamoylputrescine amidase